MELIILLAVLVICLAIGVPVAFSLLAAAIACFVALDIPLVVVFQRMAAGVSDSPLSSSGSTISTRLRPRALAR